MANYALARGLNWAKVGALADSKGRAASKRNRGSGGADSGKSDKEGQSIKIVGGKFKPIKKQPKVELLFQSVDEQMRAKKRRFRRICGIAPLAPPQTAEREILQKYLMVAQQKIGNSEHLIPKAIT